MKAGLWGLMWLCLALAAQPVVASDSASGAPFSWIDADSALILSNPNPLPAPIAEAWWQSLGHFLALPSAAESGLNLSGTWAIHSIGSWPIGHWPVADPERLAAWLDRLPGFVNKADEHDALRWRATPEWATNTGLAIHLDGDWLTVAWVADDLNLLRRVTRQTRPLHSYQARRLHELVNAYGLDGHAVAILQAQALAHQLPEPLCQGEAAAVASALPKLVAGTTAVASHGLSAQLTMPLSDGIREPMQRIVAQRPNLAADHPELQGQQLSVGLAADLAASRDAALAMTTFWLSQSWHCAPLAALNPAMQSLHAWVNRPVPPLFTGIQGLRVRVDGVDPVEASSAFYLRNPGLIIGLMQLLSPPLAALDLRPGAGVQQLPQDAIPGLPQAPISLLSAAHALAVGVGEQAAQRLPAAIDERASEGTVLRVNAVGQDWPAALSWLPNSLSGPVLAWLQPWPLSEAQFAIRLNADQLTLEAKMAWPTMANAQRPDVPESAGLSQRDVD